MSWTNLHERLYGIGNPVAQSTAKDQTEACLRVVVREDPEFVTGVAHAVEVFEQGAWSELCAHAYAGDASQTLWKAKQEHRILHGY